MLASSREYSYIPANQPYSLSEFENYSEHTEHQQSDARPKLYGVESNYMSGDSMNGQHLGLGRSFQYNHSLPPQGYGSSNMEHEPLMLSMQDQKFFYSQVGQQPVLPIHGDYNSGTPMGGASETSDTPRSHGHNARRSREELNLKEKKRMFKLNDRIAQLKELLDEAGVQSKKNKQSVLDNTHHYISMLRSYLVIAKQKAERAERQLDRYKQQSIQVNVPDATIQRSFEQSSTARIIIGLDSKVQALNSAFVAHTALPRNAIIDKDSAQSYLCLDASRFDAIIKNVSEKNYSTCALVQARTGNGIRTVTLMASLVSDEQGKPYAVEFNLIPVDASFEPSHSSGKDSVKESPSGVSELML
uniref:DNA binding protein putative n=1 Tax=Albugo laibachii Nc14 TaxID=890382 RepID=F0W828_9STRA|nr:DNA binding protein putative [Albugo laibachii Nc14]|eukprot:CCA17281.1 DNA binding protein putative [Albugo laibachii Nc14]